MSRFRSVERDALRDYELADDIELTSAAALVVSQAIRDGHILLPEVTA